MGRLCARPQNTDEAYFAGRVRVVADRTRSGRAARLTARFLINSVELMAVLVEHRSEPRSVSAGSTGQHLAPRLRIGNRIYLLFIEVPQD
jgi:hypothetical protein